MTLSRANCRLCWGSGMVRSSGRSERPCDCVHIRIGRSVASRFSEWGDCYLYGEAFVFVAMWRADVRIAARAVLDAGEREAFEALVSGKRWDDPALDKVTRGRLRHTETRVYRKMGAEILRRCLFPSDEYFEMPRQMTIAA